MIRVLQGWGEVGEATLALQRRGLPTHSSVLKNWDLFGLYVTLAECDKTAPIVDLGCGAGETLKLLYALGFKQIHGMDFEISWRLRLGQLARMVRRKSIRAPYRLHRGDITKTDFPDESFHCATCISVVEHGVELQAFFKEVHRLLRPSGKLFLTTDYWEEKINTDTSVRAFGLPWKVFSRREIEALITTARNVGLELDSETKIPCCSEKAVFWQNADYTFINLIFTKPAENEAQTL